MIGTGYWATGIMLSYHPGGTGGPMAKPEPRVWGAKVEFFDDGFCQIASTEGELHTRYALPTLDEAIDLIKADAERFGIVWKDPTIYVPGDGEDDDPLPDNWGWLVAEQCRRLGWRTVYAEDKGAPF